MTPIILENVDPRDPIGGPLPRGWRLSSLGHLCDEHGGDVQTGPFGSQLHASDYVVDGVPSVMPKDLVGERIRIDTIARVSEDDAARLSTHRLRVGDIVYARRGDIGRRALVTADEEGWLCGTGCLRIRVNCDEVASEYLLAYLGHPAIRAWVESKAQGATMLNLNTSILRALPLRIPPLEEQLRIAAIIDKADAIRRKRKEAIALTEELLRSAFLEIFGDPVTNPKGWPVKPLGNYLSFITSGSRGWAEHYSEVGERFIRSLDVRMDRISDEDAAYVVAPVGAEAQRTRVQLDDVLLTITGSRIGRAARASSAHANAYVSQHVAILRLLPGLDPDVLTAFLVNDRGGQALIAKTQYGQTKPGLNLAQIRAFPIAVPEPEVQLKLRAVRREIRASHSLVVEALQMSENTFASLVHNAFAKGNQKSEQKQLDLAL